MRCRSRNVTGPLSAQELDPDVSQTKAGALGATDLNVTTHSPQKAPRTQSRGAALPDGKKTKRRPAGKSDSKPKATPPKLPFDFADQQFSESVYLQIQTACLRTDGHLEDSSFDSILSVMLTQNPKDPLELMLINQMTSVNALVMKYIGRLGKSQTISEIDIAERTLNKLARTFATQFGALHRFRSDADPKVTLQQNVSVTADQAIVDTVTQNPRDENKADAATTPAAITDARSTPMPIIEGNEQLVTVPAKKGQHR